MECFESRFWFNLPVFHTNYISNCSLSSRLFTYQVFSGVSLKKLASSRSKMYREPMKWRQYRRKWGKFGLLNLLNKDGDLSFLFSVCSWRHTFMQIKRPPCWCSSQVWNFMQIYRHLYRALFQILCFMGISGEKIQNHKRIFSLGYLCFWTKRRA